MKELEYWEVKMKTSIHDFAVISVDKRSETHVSGYGGGGTINTNVGGKSSIDPIHISSNVTQIQDIWLRRADRSEFMITLTNKKLAVKAGQKLRFYNVEVDSEMYFVGVRNVNTGEFASIDSDLTGAVCSRFYKSDLATGKGWVVLQRTLFVVFILSILLSFTSKNMMALAYTFAIGVGTIFILKMIEKYVDSFNEKIKKDFESFVFNEVISENS